MRGRSPAAAGADGARFALTSAGALTFAVAKDFEAPDDANGDGTYEVSVQVSDGERTASANLTVTLTNRNEAPEAEAGVDQANVEGGATVTLSGSGSDPDAGDTLSYAWTQTGGTAVTLSGGDAATATFDAPTGLAVDETLTFRLRATDAGGLYGEDSTSVGVEAAPPLTAAFQSRPRVARRLHGLSDGTAFQRGGGAQLSSLRVRPGEGQRRHPGKGAAAGPSEQHWMGLPGEARRG